MNETQRKDPMTFTIDADNIIAMLASQETDLREVGTDTFSSPHQLNALAAKSPGPRLVEIRNKLPGVAPVERFTSRWDQQQPRRFVLRNEASKMARHRCDVS
jgi:hypothetical protein